LGSVEMIRRYCSDRGKTWVTRAASITAGRPGGCSRSDPTKGRTMTQTGLIGVGIMGSAMATHLLAAGHDVIGYDTDPARLAGLSAAGGSAAGSAAEVAAAADVVILSLPTPDAVTAGCAG